MATTTNYGWTTPDDTALVKDGAAAIRTLGSSVDTTTKALNPSTTLGDIEYRSSTANTNTRLGIGTSGQALTVVAGVPSWAASATSVLTTTGDVLYASAANTLARLGIGTAGQVLKVNSGATAPEWGTASAGKTFSLLNAGGTALTGATTITVSGLSGDDIYVVINAASTNLASANIDIRLNSDSTSKYSLAGYGELDLSTRTLINDGTPNGKDAYRLATMSSQAASNMSGFLQIRGASTSGIKLITAIASADAGGSGTNYRAANTQGTYTGTSAITSISIISSNGNFDNGTIYVYGAN